ncbi:MAG: cell division protein FtsA [Candidatus Nealsonbacteria bacterium]|nr:cell division protein FtsA [Candidatus Nealsonbacteria bacterium]
MNKEKIITGLDIGTGMIKILSALKKPNQEELEVLSFHQEPSFGVRRGVVVNINKVAEIIVSLIRKVEKETGQKINNVYANIGGSHIFSASSHETIAVSRADQKIFEEDINRILQAAQTFPLSVNKEILDIFPKEFIVDGEKGIKEPIGMKGGRLEAEMLVVGGFSPYIKNLTQAILNSGLQRIDDIVSNPLASARAVLAEQEKELGVVLLDIGAGTTDLAVFEEGTLMGLTIIPIGSTNITYDITVGLKTDIETAERIKLEFGSVQTSSLLKEKIKKKKKNSKKNFDFLSERIKIEGDEPIFFSKKILREIIESRVKEIFREVQKELKKISKTGSLPAGVVLTGGGAKLPKIKDFCKKELKLPCRIGLVQGLFPPQDDSALSSVCGLVLAGADLEKENQIFQGGFMDKIKKILKNFIP